MNLTVDTAAAILAQANELEFGLAVTPEGESPLESIRSIFYKAIEKCPQFNNLMVCAMKDPNEIWLVKKDTELPE